MSIHIGAATDTIKRGARPAKLVLVVAFLLLASSGSIVFGAGLGDYVVGGGGEFECFPKYEFPDCGEEVSGLSEAGRAIYAVLEECSARVEDKSGLQKFVMAGSLLVAWTPMGAALAKQAWSDVPYELVACFLSGLTRVSNLHPDQAEAMRDLINGIETLRDTTMDAAGARKWFKDVKKVEKFAKAWEAWELGLHRADLVDISQLLRTLDNVYPAAEALRRLDEAERLSRTCEFEQGLQKLELAEKALRKYCEWQGYGYRKYEKVVECYYEDYAEYIHMGNNPQTDEFIKLRSGLEMRRDRILRQLEMFQEIKQLRRVTEKRKEFFLDRKKEYLGTALVTHTAIEEGDLELACRGILGLHSIKEKATEGYINCPDKVAPDLEKLEERVFDLYWEKVLDVEELLKQAENAITDDQLNEARSSLQVAKQKIPHLIYPQHNKCSLGLDGPRLLGEIEKLEERLGTLVDRASSVPEGFDEIPEGFDLPRSQNPAW